MKRMPRDVLLICLLFAPLAQGAFAPVTPQREESLDEVVVNGARLNQIMQEMVQMEDQFFERYNELNTKDDFDMHCFQGARVGTRLKRRYCLAAYMDRALQSEGQEYALFLKRLYDGADLGGTTYSPSNQPPPMRGLPPVGAMVTIEARRKDFKQNMRDVVTRNPELVDMLRQRYELGSRYENARRKLWGLKPFPEEKESATAAPASR